MARLTLDAERPADTEDARIEAAVAAALAKMAAAAKPADVSTNDHAWMQKLALSIAELSDQGTGRVRVEPAELERREEGKREMFALLREAMYLPPGQGPVYRLRGKVFLNNILIEHMWLDPTSHSMRPTIIEHRDIPAENMLPDNEVARGIYAAFVKSIGTVDPKGNWAEHTDYGSYKFTPGGSVILEGPIKVKEAEQTGNEDRRQHDEFRAQLAVTTVLSGPDRKLPQSEKQAIIGTIHAGVENTP